MVGDAYFSYVVHRAREKDLVPEHFIQAEHPGKGVGVIADALHMGTSVFILVFRRAHHRVNGFQRAFLKIGGPFPHSLFQYVIVIVQFLVQQTHFQHVANTHQHLGQLKRFADEILRACPERAEFVIRLGGDDKHRKIAVRFNFLEPLHHLKPIHAWHQKIEQDQVVAILEVELADLARVHCGSD